MKISDIMTPEQADFYRYKLAAKVVKDGDCLLWTGAVSSKDGYGKIRIAGKTWGVHRLQYFLQNGEITALDRVMHSCDTPVCINPGHLSAGREVDNVRDMIAKQRAYHQRYPEEFRCIQQSISTQTVLESIRDFLNGRPKDQIAKERGFSQSRLVSFLVTALGSADYEYVTGVVKARPFEKRERTFSKKRQVAIDLIKNGETLEGAAEKVGACYHSVAGWARAEGITFTRKKKISDEVATSVISDVNSGMRKDEVAKKYGISLCSVYKCLKG
jgi:hypothetical protein